MNEEEKKRRALEFFEAEQARLLNRSNTVLDAHAAVLDVHTAQIQASLARSERQLCTMTSLAKNGITWEQLKAVYDEAVENGKNDMIQLNMGYFYAGMAIAFKEAVPAASPDDVLDFLHAVATRMGEEESTDSIIAKAQDVVGLDLKSFDTPPKPIPRSSRKDRAAAERMRKSGITQADHDYEKEIGYQHGWNSEFFYSACYATVVLVLHNRYGRGQEEIEGFIERLEELKYEEISRADILARAKRETGIDGGWDCVNNNKSPAWYSGAIGMAARHAPPYASSDSPSAASKPGPLQGERGGIVHRVVKPPGEPYIRRIRNPRAYF